MLCLNFHKGYFSLNKPNCILVSENNKLFFFRHLVSTSREKPETHVHPKNENSVIINKKNALKPSVCHLDTCYKWHEASSTILCHCKEKTALTFRFKEIYRGFEWHEIENLIFGDSCHC